MKEILIRQNILLLDALSQCYDRTKIWLNTQIISQPPKTFFTHFFGQALNLAVGDSVDGILYLTDDTDTTVTKPLSLKEVTKKRCNVSKNS